MLSEFLPAPSPTFAWMENQSDWIVIWLAAFFPIIVAKILVLKRRGIERAKDSMFFTEAIGLPLTFMQPVAFVKSLMLHDWLATFVTLWWGPGFVFVVFLVLGSKRFGYKINWIPYRVTISWLCKILYVVYLGLCIAWGFPKFAFALSAWIASDQIDKSFGSLDADRARRSFHDAWLVRILYPSCLFLPFLFAGFSNWEKAFGVLLFITWASGLAYVRGKRYFMTLPEDPSLLRNMMYFKKD